MKYFGTAVILAGGKSSRMGFDKQFMEIQNNVIVDVLYEILKKEFNDVLVITNKPYKYSNPPFRIKTDELPSMGPLSGIHSALKSSQSEYAYFIACDMPNVSLPYIRFMKKKLLEKKSNACITKTNKGIEPFNAFYNISIINTIENLLKGNKKSMLSLVDSIDTFYVEEYEARAYSNNLEMFTNINTKAELYRFLNTKGKTL
ncbi:molybdenum cofactor guanylyltransferase [Clostridium felsineum]|uniref:molybdenum cofactor guanylyltransferase n=1 Tax=Clostridium felsineum TaxID=36839 RepID=UPI00098C1EB1|nr:molybdenum cofactor guanylyltransferase [Clostridium felsineum]URZ14203.1 putative molybdenum cofactor guanylyltransferase [Clostridium felsineum DSM 794]